MIKSLLLNNESWDIGVDGSGNIAGATGKYRVAQDVASSIRLFTNDAYFNTAQGMPYWLCTLALPLQEALTRAHMRENALRVPNVTGVRSVTFESLDNRVLRGDVLVTDNINEDPLASEMTLAPNTNIYRVRNIYSLGNVYDIEAMT